MGLAIDRVGAAYDASRREPRPSSDLRDPSRARGPAGSADATQCERSREAAAFERSEQRSCEAAAFERSERSERSREATAFGRSERSRTDPPKLSILFRP